MKKDNRGSTLSQKNSVENNAVNVASSEKFESDKVSRTGGRNTLVLPTIKVRKISYNACDC